MDKREFDDDYWELLWHGGLKQRLGSFALHRKGVGNDSFNKRPLVW